MDELVAQERTAAPENTPAPTPRQLLEAWTRRKLLAFERVVDDDGEYLSKIYPTAKSMSEQVAADYHGRFLIELIQNAHDVHPAVRTDGEIEVLFDRRTGDHGVLYVANGGAPFSKANVEALSDLGLSSKSPGQSIGNKGLGFRSVGHVCSGPEIYSQSPGREGAERFEGYCFRFAADDDLAALIADPCILALARRDLPPFHIPVWLDDQPPAIGDFARRGFATVIALPLRDAVAADAVVAEIATLRGQRVPMLLFLSRLKRLEVRVVETDGIEADPYVLNRQEAPVVNGPGGLSIADLGTAGRHLVARCAIPEVRMREAIEAGVAAKQLHSHWRDWAGDGDVAVAVRLDGASVDASRLFTYLPMGEEAEAPFPGYLHGSFFPTANRKSLDGGVRLNAMLLESAADLAAETAAWLAGNRDVADPGLTAEDRVWAAVDLLCWSGTKSFTTAADLPKRVATTVAAAMGVTDILDAPVAPVLAPGGVAESVPTWRTPRVARRWAYAGPTFSTAAAAEHAAAVGVWPLWPSLGGRMDRFIGFLKAQASAYQEAATSPERAALAAAVAGRLHARTPKAPAAWAAFYRELPEFVGNGGAALADRLVLLGADGALHPAMSTAAAPAASEAAPPSVRRRLRRTGRVAVFAPPGRRGVDDEDSKLAPPAALAGNFAFLDEALDWHGELGEARLYLVRHRLIFDFDRESILTQLARVLREDTRNQSRAAGLRWAFQIWRPSKGTGRSVSLPANLRLFVPTQGADFIAAEEAMFSAKWPPDTNGSLLQRFLDAAPADSIDLADVARRRLADPDHYAFRVGSKEQWVAFLDELGVKRGLNPFSKPLSGRYRGEALDGAAVWVEHGLPPAHVEAWKAAVRTGKPAAITSTSIYLLSGDLQWMPGQWDVDRYDREALECFARLVVDWLGGDLPENWDVTIRHAHFNQSDVRSWPTPLRVFLRDAAWFPAQEPSPGGPVPVKVRGRDIWMAAESGERFPSFLRRPSPAIARALERAGSTQMAALRDHAAFRTMDRPDTLLAQAGFLADQYARPGFDLFFERRLANLYAGTWQRIVEKYRLLAAPDPALAPVRVLARRNVALEAFVARGDAATKETIYVRDVEDETAASLVEAAGLPLMDVRVGDRSRLGALLKGFYGERVRLLSEVDYQITVDGRDVDGEGVGDILAWCPRLVAMVAVAMEGLKGFEAQTLPANRHAVLDHLERIGVQVGERLGFQLDEVASNRIEGGPEALNVVLAAGRQVVVIRSDGLIGWAQLERGLEALCDALGQPALEQGLRILARSLAASGAQLSDPEGELDLDELCDSLRLRATARRAVRETLGSGLERYVPWIRALLFMGGGQAAVDDFAQVEAEVIQDADLLREAISPSLTFVGGGATTAIDACRASLSIAELREALELDFEDLNRALVAVGLQPDTYADIHLRQLANRIKAASIQIADALRAVFRVTLAGGQAAPGYATARDTVAELAPDPDWLTRWRDVPEAVLDQHIDAWLALQGASSFSSNHTDLPPLEDTRRANGQVLKAFAREAADLVRAWCGARGRPLPAPWNAPDGGFADLRSRLDRAGVFDWQPLDRDAVLDWTQRLEAWPSEMAVTLDRSAHDLGEAALAAARERAEADAAARRKQERSVEFNGAARDPEETDWTALDAELTQSLSKAVLRTPLNQPARLAAALGTVAGGGARLPSGGGGGFRFTTPPPKTFAPSAKTEMIGRLGELVVRKWLQARLQTQDVDSGWVSSNAEPFTGRAGRDGLGYDFEVSVQRQTWQIEVKASLNDPLMFQLGETEVKAARIAARTRVGLQYWIAYVSNLADPAQIRVELIPNPLAEAGEAVLDLVGEGLRYSFRRT